MLASTTTWYISFPLLVAHIIVMRSDFISPMPVFVMSGVLVVPPQDKVTFKRELFPISFSPYSVGADARVVIWSTFA